MIRLRPRPMNDVQEKSEHEGLKKMGLSGKSHELRFRANIISRPSKACSQKTHYYYSGNPQC